MKLFTKLSKEPLLKWSHFLWDSLHDSVVYLDLVLRILSKIRVIRPTPIRKVRWEPTRFESNPADIENSSGTLAVTIHIHYADLIPELKLILNKIEHPFDLFITTTSAEIYTQLLVLPEELPLTLKKYFFRLVPNRGRNFGPLLVEYGAKIAQNYDYMLNIHSKKSLHSPTLSGWAHYLFTSLIPDSSTVKLTLSHLKNDPEIGVIFPPYYEYLGYLKDPWGGHRESGNEWLTDNLLSIPKKDFTFPAGGMFWARVQAIQPLLSAPWEYEDFAEEDFASDPTFQTAFMVERLVGIVPLQSGYRNLYCTKGGFTFDDSFRLRKGIFSNFSNRLLIRNIQL